MTLCLWLVWFTAAHDQLLRPGRQGGLLSIRVIGYRGRSLDLRLTRDSLTIRGRDGAALPITLCVDGELLDFVVGTTRVFRIERRRSGRRNP